MTARHRATLLRLIALVVTVCASAAAVPDAGAWSARKPTPAARPKSASKAKRPAGSKVPAATQQQEAMLAERAAGLLAQPKPAPGALLQLLRRAVGEREMALAAQLAERLLGTAAGAGVLQEAARTLGVGSNLAVVPRLWAAAWQKAKGSAMLRAQIAEGYADALLAAGLPDAAREVLTEALRGTPRGQRRAIYERLAAVARLQGDSDGLLQALLTSADPDGLVLAAQLQTEAGDDDAAQQTLARAWARFPGHRALQAAYVQFLQRQGDRETLQRVVEQVVRLAPADPLPWLAVIDADLAVRDRDAARARIDALVARYPRHAGLLEALLDREQRLGDDAGRIGRLYELLVQASPGDPQPIEAWGEWLLTRGDEAKALVVLSRLLRLPGGQIDGLRRQIELLLAHNRTGAAMVLLSKLRELAPEDPKVLRLQAQLAERSAKPQDAEPWWLALCEVPADANPSQRARAAEARVALGALYRRARLLPERTAALQQTARQRPLRLGETLLWFDLVGQHDDPLAVAGWLEMAEQQRALHAKDPEVLAAVAAGQLQRSQLAAALTTLQTLHPIEPDLAEPLLTQLLEASLSRADVASAATCEALLTARPGGVTSGVLLRLGELRLRFGDRTAAAQWFKRAAAANPGDTRAAGRLAALLRHAGAVDEEAATLRILIERTADPDELERAGQRLLTLSLAQGTAVELVRWLDAIAPNHPRRADLWRLRMAAWEAWQRTVALDDSAAVAGPLPGPGPLGDALASGDLGAQVRALRHLAAQRRPVPEALARQFLLGDSPVLRRDAALALGYAGSVRAAELIRDALVQGAGPDEASQLAMLWALGKLPAVDGTEQALLFFVRRSSTGAALAAVLLGHHGSPERLADLAALVQGPRREIATAAVLGLGMGAARHAATAEAAAALGFLRTHLDQVAQGSDPMRVVAALWAVAAAGEGPLREPSRQILLHNAQRLRSATLMRVVIGLAAAPRPLLQLPDVAVGDVDALRELPTRTVRELLMPWVAPTDAVLQRALTLLADDLRKAWGPQPASPVWCAALGVAATAAVPELCSMRP